MAAEKSGIGSRRAFLKISAVLLEGMMWATGTDDKWRFSQEFAQRVMARL